MAIALSGRFFANHNKKSRGQNCYHVVNKPENNNIGLVYIIYQQIPHNFNNHWPSSHYAVMHMHNKNSNIQGQSPNVVK